MTPPDITQFDRADLLDSLTMRERMAIAVDLVAQITNGPLHTGLHFDGDTNQAERMALMTLSIAADRGEAMTMSELGSWIGLSRAAVTALADRFERAGVIVRLPDSTDRRRTILEITSHGVNLVNTALDHDHTPADAKALVAA